VAVTLAGADEAGRFACDEGERTGNPAKELEAFRPAGVDPIGR
jgi:hypothetical protein